MRRWWEFYKTAPAGLLREDYPVLAVRSIGLHDPFLGMEILEQAKKLWPDDVEIRLLEGRCLSICGASKRALELVEKMYQQGNQQFQILLLLGDLTRESLRWAETRKEASGKLIHCCTLAERLIRSATPGDDLLSAVCLAAESASSCLLHDKPVEARRLATLVEQQCQRRVNPSELETPARLKLLGTQVQAALLLNRFDEAGGFIHRLAELARSDAAADHWPDLGKIRSNCRRLLQHLGRDESILNALQVPRVAVFTGHMVDMPGREIPRFPIEKEGMVAARLADEIDRLNPAFGYASGACGGDILFHEAMLQRGKQIHLVLPCPTDEFRQACLDRFPGRDWSGRFDRIRQAASSVLILSQQCANDNAMASECCNRVILGLAMLQAGTLGSEVMTLALWDGRKGDAVGGTYSLVELSLAAGIETRTIDVLKPEAETCDASQARVSLARSSAVVLAGADFDPPQQICALLFADVVHYSKLKERQIPRFVEYYLQDVSQMFEAAGKSVLAKNTWGDGLYGAFDSVKAAGLFALQLRDSVRSRDWAMAELPAELNVRIGLHAGPVYRIHDPVVNQTMFMGSHVSMAGRIEPRTQPGQVYCSQVFAALAAAEGVKEFTCEYVGVLEWAKGYGSFPTYVVERLMAENE